MVNILREKARKIPIVSILFVLIFLTPAIEKWLGG